MNAIANGQLPTEPAQAPPLVAELPSRKIMGVPVSVATTEQALAYLDDRLQRRVPTRVAFFNANTSNVAAAQPRLAAALQDFVVFCDGIGADIASWVLHGSAFPDNLNGTDFVPLFLRSTRHALRVFVLGSRPDVLQRAVAAFRHQAPQHEYVGSHHGYFQPDEVPAIVERIKNLQADVLLVALGTPLQEFWLADHFAATQCRMGIAVGGLLDFVSEEKPRAPLWVRRIRMEWVYRLMLEPGRMWRRYIIGNVRFMARLARAALARKHRV
ncbi:MAG TPA: WecB/TagA/CpsF family glycosyltransferase [Xanthobacteraceae bacterium]|nr:WecB/TagA/CpsF family glycosyltransferase [Xanthobacteraceae bacterium]